MRKPEMYIGWSNLLSSTAPLQALARAGLGVVIIDAFPLFDLSVWSEFSPWEE